MSQPCIITVDEDDTGRSTHTLERSIRGCRTQDLHVGKHQRVAQDNAFISVLVGRDIVDDALYTYLRCRGTTYVTAHAVTDYKQLTVLGAGITAVVLVGLADLTYDRLTYSVERAVLYIIRYHII